MTSQLQVNSSVKISGSQPSLRAEREQIMQNERKRLTACGEAKIVRIPNCLGQ